MYSKQNKIVGNCSKWKVHGKFINTNTRFDCMSIVNSFVLHFFLWVLAKGLKILGLYIMVALVTVDILGLNIEIIVKGQL